MVQESPKSESRANQTKERKDDHIRICLEEDVRAKDITTGFEDIYLVHRALPEIDLSRVNLTTSVFNHRFLAPIVVEAITGGTEKALQINATIAQAVEELGLGMGVGSQRAALENPKLERTFSIARRKAPNAFLVANIGASQIAKDDFIRKATKSVEMISADALVIHLNPLQEAVQPEGETDYAGILQRIKQITGSIDVPVIVKETGAGIAAEEAKKLKEAGVSGIDVAGAGGTSWAAVEYYRAKQRGDIEGQEIGKDLWDWGIPTVVSLVEIVKSDSLPVIASGGVRSGKDIAKSLALGAALAGLAFPVLRPALKNSEEVEKKIQLITHELKTVMFLAGADSVERLSTSSLIITGKTADWLQKRGFDLEAYARRGGH